MRKINAMLLALIITVAPCFAKAELCAEEVEFIKERTAEWEGAYGPNETWDCRLLGLFCTIYKNYPNGTCEVDEVYLPSIPPDDLKISSEEATSIARAFLIDYEPRITSEYMQRLAPGVRFIDVTYTVYSLTARCSRIWIVKFYEDTGNYNYEMRCDAYINADSGQVYMIDLMLDGTSEIIEF